MDDEDHIRVVPANSYVERGEIRRVVQEELQRLVAPAVGEAIGILLREFEQRFVAKLETVSLAYKGQWQEAMSYQRGDFVSMGGSVWHCNGATTARPGTDDSWSLAVKSGRDGRDGKDAAPAAPAAPADHPLEPEQRTVRSARAHPR